ncbi:MAG: hypothetical protein RL681_767, partial [Candidatus Parcubacteria bacterium]
MKFFSLKELIPLLLIAAAAATGIAVYNQLPSLVPTHWGISGEVNGWSDRSSFVWWFPALMFFLYLVLTFIPYIDPRRDNIMAAAREYFILRTAFVVFLCVLYVSILGSALGLAVNIKTVIMLCTAALFFVIGSLLPAFKRNYTIGIRLPWTLESDEVWDAVHRIGKVVFRALAAIVAILAFL